MRCIQSETDAWNYALNTGPSNSSDVALANLWARGAITADICYRNQKKIGSLISSAFVARDMIRIVDALGEDGLLRYYGKHSLVHYRTPGIGIIKLTHYVRVFIRNNSWCYRCRHVPR